MPVPITSPIYQFIGRQIGILPTDVTVTNGILTITVPTAELGRRAVATLRYELDRVYSQRYDRIAIIIG